MRALHHSSVASLGHWQALHNSQQLLLRTCCPVSGLAVSASNSCTQPIVEHSYVAPTEAHTQHIAAELAASRAPGDVYCLHGDVGAGKSAFSRAFIRAAADDAALPVPSPTYLLQIAYEDQDGPPIHHFDLYRLEHAQEQSLARLNLAHSFSQAVSLIEWPERLPHSVVPQQRLEVHIEVLPEINQDLVSNWPGAAADSNGGVQPQEQQQQQHLLGQEGMLIPLSAAVVQEAAAAAAAAAQSLTGTSIGTCQAAADGEESDSDEFIDSRQRRLVLRGHGDKWQARLTALAARLAEQQQEHQCRQQS